MHSATSIRLARLAAIRLAKAKLDGEETELLAELASLPDAEGKEWIREDVAVAMRLAPVTAHHRLHQAADLTQRFPDTVAAMRRGEFGRFYADRLADATIGMSEQAASNVEAQVLPRAGRQTYSQFSAALRRAVVRFDDRAAQRNADLDRAERKVIFSSQSIGVGELWASLPIEELEAIRGRVQALADSWNGLDERTAEQRRADALVALCLGTHNITATSTGSGVDPSAAASAAGAGGVRPNVNLTIPLDVLLATRRLLDAHADSDGDTDTDTDTDTGGGDDGDGRDCGEPADLNGEPLPAKLARLIATDPTGVWRRIVTDPVGQVLDVGRSTYTPTAAIKRHVRHRDRTCRFTGCGRKARRCELDHVLAWDDGGPTADWNLIPLCPRHHHLKHDGGWRVQRLEDGTVRWTSPNGQVSERRPDD